MRVELITIRGEILIGQFVDTNSACMGQQLNAIGASVQRIITVSDDKEGKATLYLQNRSVSPVEDKDLSTYNKTSRSVVSIQF